MLGGGVCSLTVIHLFVAVGGRKQLGSDLDVEGSGLGVGDKGRE